MIGNWIIFFCGVLEQITTNTLYFLNKNIKIEIEKVNK